MIYEYRCYEIAPGRAQALHDRFTQHTIGLMRSHGFHIQGIWEAVVGQANQLHYLLKWADAAEREKCTEAFESDPKWRAALAATPGLTGRRYNELWRPTGYSPQTQAVWPDGAVD
jgi:hypothetical protein